MVTSMNNYHSTQVTARISQFRWPDLRRILIQASDGWLWYLEGLNLEGRQRLSLKRFVELQQFLVLGGIPGRLYVQDAVDAVFEFQELIFGPGRLALLGNEDEEDQPEERGSGGGALLPDQEAGGGAAGSEASSDQGRVVVVVDA